MKRTVQALPLGKCVYILSKLTSFHVVVNSTVQLNLTEWRHLCSEYYFRNSNAAPDKPA